MPELTDDELDLEKEIINLFPMVGFGNPQPDHITADVMQRWIHYAYRYSDATGDKTYLEYTDGSELFPPYVTYHDQPTKPERKKEIKK